jgi:hypothetical protein
MSILPSVTNQKQFVTLNIAGQLTLIVYGQGQAERQSMILMMTDTNLLMIV